jgi:hypothetical protein
VVKATCPVWGALGGIPLPKGSMDAVLRLHGDMGICAACQQAAAIAMLPVLTAAGQQTLWHPIRDAERLATYRATAGPLPAWWDRCVATAPARVCPCGSYRLHWSEDETT